MNIHTNTNTNTLYVAGGCFWGVEAFYQAIPGVLHVENGYANGSFPNPTYEDLCHHNSGHAETVRITFDPAIVSYEALVRALFLIIDPTSLNRQGNDCGTQYRTGIYYTNEKEQAIATRIVREIQKEYEKPIVVEVCPLERFDDAEDYHQDYLDKHPDGYCHVNLGRAIHDLYEQRIAALTPMSYAVTQENATEPPFTSEYTDFDEDGIYVDIITGVPLFSSEDKFPCPCGWPSFAKPIQEDAVTYQEDHSHGMHRIEVRSASSDAHLGHVFDDGPADLGGKRYCINGAAIRFIPRHKQ